MNPIRKFPPAPVLLAALLVGAMGCSLWPVEKRVLADSRHIRISALKKIRSMEADQRERLAAPLIAALGVPDDRVTNRASEALVAVGEPAVAPLIRATESEDPFIRTLAVTILGDIGTPANQIGPTLVSALDDPHPLVRAEAAHALGRLGSAGMGGVPALLLTLRDEEPEVREAAQSALKRLGVEAPEAPKTSANFSALSRQRSRND